MSATPGCSSCLTSATCHGSRTRTRSSRPPRPSSLGRGRQAPSRSRSGSLRRMEIRRYATSDRERVWELHRLGLEQTGTDAGPGPWDDDLSDVDGSYLAVGGEF